MTATVMTDGPPARGPPPTGRRRSDGPGPGRWCRASSGPPLYLVVMGVVLGDLVADDAGTLDLWAGSTTSGSSVPPSSSVTALMTASHEATSPVFHAMRSDRTYAAMAATPLTVGDIVGGHLLWMALRVAATVGLMTVVVGALGGAQQRPGGPPGARQRRRSGPPIAAAVTALAARQQIAGALLAWQRFGVVPMILFCGVYFPVEALPAAWLGVVVRPAPVARRRAEPRAGPRHGHAAHRAPPPRLPGRPRGRWAPARPSGPSGPGWGLMLAAPTRRAWPVSSATSSCTASAPIVVLSGFFEPVFYLLSMTIGVGALVGDITLADGSTVSYAAFVAPALLAASAMNGAFYESTYQLYIKLLDGRSYEGILATPVTVADMAAGRRAGRWCAARSTPSGSWP